MAFVAMSLVKVVVPALLTVVFVHHLQVHVAVMRVVIMAKPVLHVLQIVLVHLRSVAAPSAVMAPAITVKPVAPVPKTAAPVPLARVVVTTSVIMVRPAPHVLTTVVRVFHPWVLSVAITSATMGKLVARVPTTVARVAVHVCPVVRWRVVKPMVAAASAPMLVGEHPTPLSVKPQPITPPSRQWQIKLL